MPSIKDFKKINEYEWQIPQSFRSDMRSPVKVFATRHLLETALEDLSIEQAINASTLPGLIGPIIVMPDVHQGYGFPIGGVAAMIYPEGVISPGAIGYDINCGVRLLASSISFEEAEPYLEELVTRIDQYCPSGVGKKGDLRLSSKDLEHVCRIGARWAVQKGMGTDEDLRRTEENGSLSGAEPEKISQHAKERGYEQLGTLGSGNHFLEVDMVEKIYDPRAAQAMGLQEKKLAVLIHSGSRGLGHQICTDYVSDFQKVVQRYSIKLPDRELVCAPLNSQEGQDYLAAMRCAANYAFANRQILAHQVRKAFESVFAGKVKNWYLQQVYDITHNMGNIETHTFDGKKQKVCVHRKGATRAFGPHSPGLPEEYQVLGQPVLIPGSMGTSSWVLLGTDISMQCSIGSSCHGAGRVMSRHQVKREVKGEDLRMQLKMGGIHVRAGSTNGLVEEAPQAYKDVDEVVETVCNVGIVSKVAHLKPVAVVKG